MKAARERVRWASELWPPLRLEMIDDDEQIYSNTPALPWRPSLPC